MTRFCTSKEGEENIDGQRAIRIETSRTNRFRTVLGPEFYPAILEMNRRLASPAQRTIVLRLKAD